MGKYDAISVNQLSLFTGASLSDRDKLTNMDRSRSRHRDGLQNLSILPFYTSGLDDEELENLQVAGFLQDPTSPTPARASAPPVSLLTNPRPLSPEILVANAQLTQTHTSHNPFSTIMGEHSNIGTV